MVCHVASNDVCTVHIVSDANQLEVIINEDGVVQIAVMSYNQYNDTVPLDVTSKILQVVVEGMYRALTLGALCFKFICPVDFTAKLVN